MKFGRDQMQIRAQIRRNTALRIRPHINKKTKSKHKVSTGENIIKYNNT